MKYTLTLESMTEEELDDVLAKLKGTVKVDAMGRTTTPEVKAAENVVNEVTPISTAIPVVEAPVAAPVENNGPELDKNGVPWDKRIHSSNKKMTTKGVWQKRKGVRDNEFDEVMAELKGEAPVAPAPASTDGIPPFIAKQQIPPPIPVPAAVPKAVPVEAPAAAVTPVAQPVATTPVEPAPTPVATPAPVEAPAPEAPIAFTPVRDFNGLLNFITALYSAQKISGDYIPDLIKRINTDFGSTVVNIADIANDPRMVEYSWQCLELDGKAA